MTKLKNEKTFKLGCGGSITVRDVPGTNPDWEFFHKPAFNFEIDLGEGVMVDEFLMHKNMKTILALRKMCDWMEKRI